MQPLFTDTMLTHSLVLLLLLGSIAGLIAGCALLAKPAWFLKVSNQANRWVSTRQLSRPLVRFFNLDSWFYRYNRPSGTLILCGSIYLLYYFTAIFSASVAVSHLGSASRLPQKLLEGLVDALVLASLTGAVFALLISLFLIFRPSLLKDFELRANRRISLRQSLKPLEIPRSGLDRLVTDNRRLFGTVIVMGSLYTLFALLKIWSAY